MRLILTTLLAAPAFVEVASAQITIIPSDPSEGSAGDEINIIPEENLSWEEASNHPDITIVQPGPNGLEVVSPEGLKDADTNKLLQQRKAVVRIEDEVAIINIEEFSPDLAPLEGRIFPTENSTEQDQDQSQEPPQED